MFTLPALVLASGGVLRISFGSERWRLSGSWHGHCRFQPDHRLGGEVLALHIASNDTLEAARCLTQAEQVASWEGSGGEYSVERVVSFGGEPALVGGWAGPWHFAYGFFHAPYDSVTDVATYLQRFEILDQPDGLSLSAPGYSQQPTAMGLLSGSVRIEVHPRGDAVAMVPTAAGTRTRTGETWAIDGTDEFPDHRCVIHASETAVMIAETHGDVPIDAAVDLVADLSEFDIR